MSAPPSAGAGPARAVLEEHVLGDLCAHETSPRGRADGRSLDDWCRRNGTSVPTPEAELMVDSANKVRALSVT
jgi:hypothetical protein